LFGAARLALRRRAVAKQTRDDDGGVSLVDVEGRLRLVAALVSGEFLEVRPAEGVGGTSDRSLWLPSRIDQWPLPSQNRAAFLLRTAFSSRQRHLGFPAAARALHPDSIPLASLLCVPSILASLDEDWPAARGLLHELTRDDPGWLDRQPTQGALACLQHAVVGCAPEVLGQRFDGETVQWSLDALCPRLTPEELPARCAGIAAAMPPSSSQRAATGRLRRRRSDPAQETPDLVLWGSLRPAGAAGAAALMERDLPTPADALPTGSERDGRSREQVEHVDAREQNDGDSPLAHVFEKLFTAEEYQGGNRRMDGADELDEHGDAIDELEIRQVMRTAETTQSVYKADLEIEGSASELQPSSTPADGIPYDEWDVDRRAFRRDWCMVYPERPAAPDGLDSADYMRRFKRQHRRTIHDLAGEMAQLQRRRRPRPRQPVGAEVDIDAVVDRHADTLAAKRGHPVAASQRLYLSPRRPTPELATLLLLDISLSSDSWVGGQRVLDISKTALLIFGEVLHQMEMPFAVAGFFSNSRRDCRFISVKELDEPWPAATGRTLALKPAGYTRIGPALRHGIEVLRRAPARRKLLLLLSDGKPTDYDAYEGKRGIADVRHALLEARSNGLATFALAVEAASRHYLPRMFGRSGFSVLSDPRALPDKAVEICMRLTR